VSGQLHARAALAPEKESPVPIAQEVGLTPEPVWTTWRRENSWSYRGSNSDPSVVQPVGSRCINYAIPAPPSRPTTRHFFQPNFCGNSPYITSSLTRRVLSLMNMLRLSSSVHIAHISCYWKFFLLHYTQVLCQYRLCRADHACLTYLMLQRQLRHLIGHKLDHRQV
jgi:hypothetical protein